MPGSGGIAGRLAGTTLGIGSTFGAAAGAAAGTLALGIAVNYYIEERDRKATCARKKRWAQQGHTDAQTFYVLDSYQSAATRQPIGTRVDVPETPYTFEHYRAQCGG